MHKPVPVIVAVHFPVLVSKIWSVTGSDALSKAKNTCGWLIESKQLFTELPLKSKSGSILIRWELSALKLATNWFYKNAPIVSTVTKFTGIVCAETKCWNEKSKMRNRNFFIERNY